jgi:ankyrin repeat protein
LSPIWYACNNNQKEIVALFLDYGIDLNYSKPIAGNDNDMGSYLDWVLTTNNLAADSNFNLDSSAAYGAESLLHAAVKNGHLSMVKLLIEKGAVLNVQDQSGNTPLHYAAAAGKKDIVKHLLDHNADTSVTNVKEQKAIDYSNIKGFNEITQMLLAKSPKDIPAHPGETKEANSDHAFTNKKQALLDIKELLDAGILTQDEFDTQKKKILQD